VNINFKTSRVKIYLDSPRVSGWNEIDTVGLVDAAGKAQWPVNASASSSYGRISAAPNAPTSMTLLPEWCPIANADSSATGEVRNNEVRVFEARGWPMLAMWGERDLTATSTTAQAQTASGMGSPGPPMSSAKFSGLMLTGGTTGTAMAPMLPARPIWRGFLVNTLVMAILLRVVYLSLAVPRRFVMELARMRRGCCLKCGYELGFDFRAGCPECGWRRAPGDSRPG
jgi:hypothetical protein